MDNAKLHRMFSKTLFAVSADELRPALMGVYVQLLSGEFRMVATDGHRLSKIVDSQFKTKYKPVNMIIPPKAVQLALKNIAGEGTTRIMVQEKDAMFRIRRYHPVHSIGRRTVPRLRTGDSVG